MFFPFLQQKIKASFTSRSCTSSFYTAGPLCPAGQTALPCPEPQLSTRALRGTGNWCGVGRDDVALPAVGPYRYPQILHLEPAPREPKLRNCSTKALLAAALAGRSRGSSSLSWSHQQALHNWRVACNFRHRTAALGTSGKRANPNT